MIVFFGIEMIEGFYAVWIMLFGDYNRRYLAFVDWAAFVLRRFFVQGIIEMLSLFIMAIPGVGLFIMPLMGLWSVHNYLDYQNWNQVWWTLGLPFMSPE